MFLCRAARPGRPGARVQSALAALLLTHRYIRVDPDTSLFTMFELSRNRWQGVTGYASYNRAKPDYRHIDKQRVGKLRWKRK
ncbi:hypothetical protein HYQ43_09465 [Paracoccus pantotrophus]|uniref:Phage-Barnase-EndoU-ColicinE5/D-RelE like nuclease 2 domain-containing protein n=1 Tax=Paracoccus pantotrophus TaxID=82367 RepID=A0A7H9BZ16_PARPN|nr:hypothetical protein HYQ43_09465 [Paracoccus pantotrophus]